MREGRLSFEKRNRLLAKMTDDVAEIWSSRITACSRLRCRSRKPAALKALPGNVRTIELLEASGRLDRKVEGLAVERGTGPPRVRKTGA